MTFGLLVSHDDGAGFYWVCEQNIGYEGTFDPKYRIGANGDIYATTFEGLRVSRDGGTEPRWARRERELFFRQGDTMMAVRLESDPPFSTPSRLFTLSSWTSAPMRANYDVAPDGRFVIIRSNEAETVGTDIRVVLNWAQTLKRLAPK